MSKHKRPGAQSEASPANDEKSFSGRVIGHRDGFGFIKPDAGGEDVFVAPREMLKTMHGDRVLAKVIGLDRRGRPEAIIQDVLDHATRRLVGRLVHERGIILVVPEDQRIKHDIVIGSGDTGGAQPGQVVMAEIIDPPTRYTPPIGRVVEVLGTIDDPGMEVEIAVRKFDVPHEFSPEAERLAEKLPDQVRPADLKNRIDLRDLDLMTIDGEDARDFDDAVFAMPHGRGRQAGWRLLVAIADVSHYVKPSDAIDRDAFERATSVYFPRRVLPMLPEKLSNGLCSLKPKVDRLALVCDMIIGSDGLVKAYQFYDAVIRSAARLTYDQAWAALSHPEGPEARWLAQRYTTLESLQGVYTALAGARNERGAIELETVETQMKIDETGRIERILPRVRNEAHRIIEECMLAANTSAADFMLRAKTPSLYRVHEGPTPERLKTLREFLKIQGLRLGGNEDPQPADYAKLSHEIRQRPDARLLQTLLLRSMQQAIYSPDNVGHFGLAYEAYTHFTSPIRRYPDLMVHRVIKAKLKGQTFKPQYGGSEGADDPLSRWRNLGDHCSAAERRADEASRDVEAWLKCQFMKDRVGEQLTGTITGVAPFGVFVTLDTLYVEGLVHVSELGTEYFQHNEVVHELRGERTGRRFRLYDPVSVLVSRVDLDARRIEFRLLPSMVRSVKRSAQRPEPESFDADLGFEPEADEQIEQTERMPPGRAAASKRGQSSLAKSGANANGKANARSATEGRSSRSSRSKPAQSAKAPKASKAATRATRATRAAKATKAAKATGASKPGKGRKRR